jgi:hypothetical protein
LDQYSCRFVLNMGSDGLGFSYRRLLCGYVSNLRWVLCSGSSFGSIGCSTSSHWWSIVCGVLDLLVTSLAILAVQFLVEVISQLRSQVVHDFLGFFHHGQEVLVSICRPKLVEYLFLVGPCLSLQSLNEFGPLSIGLPETAQNPPELETFAFQGGGVVAIVLSGVLFQGSSRSSHACPEASDHRSDLHPKLSRHRRVRAVQGWKFKLFWVTGSMILLCGTTMLRVGLIGRIGIGK